MAPGIYIIFRKFWRVFGHIYLYISTHTTLLIPPSINSPLYEVQIGHKGGINRGGTPEFAAGGENFEILDIKMYLEMLVFSCKNPKVGLRNAKIFACGAYNNKRIPKIT